MSDYVAGKGWKQEKYDRIVKAGFGIFAERGIEAVQMTEVAEAAGVGRTTLFRYFPTKTELVVAIATRKWEDYIEWHNNLLSAEEMQRLTGAAYLKFFVDSFLELYRNHKDILRFNYEFNAFVRGAEWSEEQKLPYLQMVNKLSEQFHELYVRGTRDGTLNTDIPEQTMFSSTFHIMLAAVTRYAAGLAVVNESAPESELVMLAELLLSRFTKINDINKSEEEEQ